MKLILTAAVENLGVAGDIVEVKNGYGRNLLLPRGLAIVATPGAEKQIEGIKRAQEAREIRDLDHAREVKAALEALEGVTIAVRTSESGKLFGSVKTPDTADAGKAAGGPHRAKRAIPVTKNPANTPRKYQVEAKLTDGIVSRVKFEVVAA